MNRVLGKMAVEEIREAIRRCASRGETSAEAKRLAALYGVNKTRIYEITTDVRPAQKRRADRGTRQASLLETPGLKYAASLVVEYHIDPAEAVRTAAGRGFEIPVKLATFQRYLREHGLNRRHLREGRSNYRRFEAAAPGDVFQFDISGSKERWFDTRTRRIVNVSTLEVSKNHPNENRHRTRVWRFVLVDDYSRRKFVRFVCCDKPHSSHVVSFLLEAYEEMGVPKILYTDNDAIIKHGRNKRAADILNKALAASGGYQLMQHAPGNSRATGKVEVAHQQIEKFEKLLGLLLAEGRVIDLNVLDRFARQLTVETNNKKHRETGETPEARWHHKRHLVRTLDARILRSAFLADEFEINIGGDLTFSHLGARYQLPTTQRFADLVAGQSKSRRARVIFPDALDYFTLIDFDGNEYDIAKKIHQPDAFGSFKSTPSALAEKTRRTLKAYAKENAKAARTNLQQGTAAPAPIPVIDTDYQAEKSNVKRFPKPSTNVTREILETLPPGRRRVAELTELAESGKEFSEVAEVSAVAKSETSAEVVVTKNLTEFAGLAQSSESAHATISAASAYSDCSISFWQAVELFAHEFASLAECKKFLLTIFDSRDDHQPENRIHDALRLQRAA